MDTRIFSNKEAVNFGWENVKKHLGFFIIISFLLFIISMVPGFFDSWKDSTSAGYRFVYYFISVVFWFLQIVVSINIIKISLDIVYERRSDFKFKDITLLNWKLFFNYFIASLLYGLMCIVPLFIIFLLFSLFLFFKSMGVLMIILTLLGMVAIFFSIYISIRLMYYQYYVVEGALIKDSLKSSYKITKNMVWSIFVFTFLMGLINLLGMLCLFVGLFITMPLTFIASAYVYRKLKEGVGIQEKPVENPISSEIK